MRMSFPDRGRGRGARVWPGLCLILIAALLPGCRHETSAPGRSRETKPARHRPASTNLIIDLNETVLGHVIQVQAAARFVVIRCPYGALPEIGRQLRVHRGGQQVGEVKITGPRRDTEIIGDILSGEIRAGDDVSSE